MNNNKSMTLGFAITGSYCTFKRVIPELKKLCDNGIKVIPFMSENAYTTDTRFGKASEFIEEVEKITGESIIHTISGSEPVGPKNILDALVIAPCTGNTLAKIASGITDTAVTMAAKATLRNQNPLIIAVSTNDGLGANAKNIGTLLNTENVYFVPFGQDLPEKKPASLVAHMDYIDKTVYFACEGRQIQPVIMS